jgi:hypothetical protein
VSRATGEVLRYLAGNGSYSETVLKGLLLSRTVLEIDVDHEAKSDSKYERRSCKRQKYTAKLFIFDKIRLPLSSRFTRFTRFELRKVIKERVSTNEKGLF